MRVPTNNYRREQQFEIADCFSIINHKQKFVVSKIIAKLVVLYYGHFQVLECVGAIAYCLKLPETSKIHPVVHLSLP